MCLAQVLLPEVVRDEDDGYSQPACPDAGEQIKASYFFSPVQVGDDQVEVVLIEFRQGVSYRGDTCDLCFLAGESIADYLSDHLVLIHHQDVFSDDDVAYLL